MKLLSSINWPPAGRYVVAVSGGVDSVALLDLLARHPRDYQLWAVYVDHGWRDSSADIKASRQVAERHGIDWRVIRLQLRGRSEQEARRERYAALERVCRQVKAEGAITAHHLDDRIETVILNTQRGTGRQGLSGLRSQKRVLRPLLSASKSELIEYAQVQHLEWVEDPTNTDRHYRRNWVRHELLARRPQLRAEVEEAISQADGLNRQIDRLLTERLGVCVTESGHELMIPGSRLAPLSLPVLQEAIVYAGRQLDPAAEFDFRHVEQLARDLKSGGLRGSRQLAERLFVRSAHDTVAIEFKAP